MAGSSSRRAEGPTADVACRLPKIVTSRTMQNATDVEAKARKSVLMTEIPSGASWEEKNGASGSVHA